MNFSKLRGRKNWPTLLIGLGAVVGIAIGTVVVLLVDSNLLNSPLLKKQSSVSSDEDPRSIQENIPTKPTLIAKSIGNVSELCDFLESKSRADQAMALYSFVKETNADELEVFLKQSSQVGSSHLRREIQEAIVLRLAMNEPGLTLKLIEELEDSRASNLIGLVFQEWSVVNLDQAILGSAKLSGQNKKVALEGILAAKNELSINDQLKIARELGLEQFVLDQISLSIVGGGVRNPREQWKQFFEASGRDLENFSRTQREVIASIAFSWIVEEGDEVWLEIYGELSESDSYESILVHVMERVAREYPRRALKLAESSGLEDQAAQSQLIPSTSKINPKSAFDATSTIATESTRLQLQRVAVASWVESDPYEVLETLDQLPAGVRQWSQQEALLAIVDIDPETVASMISTVGDSQIKIKISHKIAYEWAKLDPNAAIRWASSDPEVREWNKELQIHILRSITREDPELAMSLALDQPIAMEAEIGLEATVIEEMVHSSLDTAIALLDQVRNSTTRHSALLTIGNAMVVKGHSDKAIELIKETPPEFQFEYFDSLSNMWAYHEPVDLYEKLRILQSDHIAENLATQLASLNSVLQYLSPEQKKGLEKFVPPALHGMLR